MWSLLGAKLRLHNAAGFSCAPSATLLALVILLSLPAAQSSAVARDAADRNAKQAQILLVDTAGEKLEEVRR